MDTGERMISFDDPKRNNVAFGINFKNRSNIFIESNFLVFDIVSQGSIDGSMDYSNIFIDADI